MVIVSLEAKKALKKAELYIVDNNTIGTKKEYDAFKNNPSGQHRNGRLLHNMEELVEYMVENPEDVRL